MDFDQLLIGAFGTSDLSNVPHDKLLAGVDALRAQFAAEDDDDNRFALWCLLYMLGAAPDLEEAFDDEEAREAAQDFIDSMEDDED